MVEDGSITGGEVGALIGDIQRTRPDELTDDPFGLGQVNREAVVLKLCTEKLGSGL